MFIFSPAVEYKDVRKSVSEYGSAGNSGGPNIAFVNFSSSSTDYTNLAKTGPTSA